MLVRVARSQAGLARALWWGLRGRKDVGRDDVALSYNGLDRAVVATIVALGVLETVVVHVLVSWPPLRWSLLALGIYGVLGLVAFDLTLRQHPHLLRGEQLLLRFGHFRSVRVGLDTLTAVRTQVRNGHKRTLETDDGELALSFMGGTNVELRFAPPASVEVDGGVHEVTTVAFAVQEPRMAVALLRTRVPDPDR
jgi:hypothetical protein